MRTIVTVLMLVLGATAASAMDAADRKAAQSTIERQIEAFRNNDSVTAYAQAAPQLQDQFPSVETFIAMVKQGYAPVLRPRRYSFETAEDAGTDEIAQGVALQDENGTDWIALYHLQKQADGSWRINGCQLKKAPGTNA